MTKSYIGAFVAALTLCMASAAGQSSVKNAHMGYVYPAGGQTGTTFQVIVGGQSLRGVREAHVTGDGVNASIVRYMGRVPRLNRAERIELRRRLQELKSGEPLPDYEAIDAGRKPPGSKTDDSKENEPKGDESKNRTGISPEIGMETEEERTPLPKNALLRKLNLLTPWEIEFIETRFLGPRDEKKVKNDQIAEMVLIEVAIDDDATPGDRELRLRTPLGLTSPLCFQVGTVPEICEQEAPPTGRRQRERVKNITGPVDLPVLLNGQIEPGDVDRFSFRALEGQHVVFVASARRLIPFLADAVPGWFQATLTLFDSDGHEVAFADDFRFDPDPVLAFVIPETGIYSLEVRDSIYRGREDFVYRIFLGEHPFVKSCFPLGGRIHEETQARLFGWNLPGKTISLDTAPGGAELRRTVIEHKGTISNFLTYTVDRLPESFETEPNDGDENAQRLKLPQIVNGRIGHAGDEDRFLFWGKSGSEIVIEVYARRLHSPLDSFLRLIDPNGDVVAFNDDCQHKQGFLHRDMGIITHHADSYIQAVLPLEGLYCVQILDSQQHGGEDYGYRLRISPPRPDFVVHIIPSSVAVRAGFAVPITAHVLRRDSFDGPVTLKLKGASSGFSLQGNVVPAGRDSIRMTLTAPRDPPGELISLKLVGTAEIFDKKIRHDAIPSDEVMQAFLYRHLLPSQELIGAAMTGRYRLKSARISSELPIRIPVKGRAEVAFKIPWRKKHMDQYDLVLDAPPQGLSLDEVTLTGNVLTFQLTSDSQAMPVGFTDNVIVEVFKKIKPRARDGESAIKNSKKIISLGVLPAIPIEIVDTQGL